MSDYVAPMPGEPVPRPDPDNSRYVVEDDTGVIGYTEYHLRGGNHYFFYHTVIDDEHEGKGVGSKLARYALDDVRARGGSVVPLCPFIAAWLERHPDYQDLVDQEIMERVGRTQH